MSTSDGKWLMNISDPGFAAYWIESLTAQVAAGEYDGIFLDSSSPPLIQGGVKLKFKLHVAIPLTLSKEMMERRRIF